MNSGLYARDGQLGDGLARGLRELIGRADDERVERVARVEPLDGAAARRALETRSRNRLGGRDLVHDQVMRGWPPSTSRAA